MSTTLPPPPPWTTVAGSFEWYVKALKDADDKIKEEHKAFFFAGAVAAHALLILDKTATLRTIEELRSWAIDREVIDGGLDDMFRHWQRKKSNRGIPRDLELHAFYSGAATVLSLLNRGGESGLPGLQREIIQLTLLIDPKKSPKQKAH